MCAAGNSPAARYDVNFYPLLFLLTLFFSFPVLADESSIVAQITQSIEDPNPPAKIAGVKINWKRLQSFYAARQYQPCWLTSSLFGEAKLPFSPQANEFAEFLNHVDEDGLVPEDYAASQLAESLRTSSTPEDVLMTELLLSDRVMQYISDMKNGHIQPEKIIAGITLPPHPADIPALLSQALSAANLPVYMGNLAPSHYEYPQLRKKLAEYRIIAAAGGWLRIPVGVSLKPGMDDPRVPALYERLRREGYLPVTLPITESHYDDTLVQAVQAFQQDHDAKPDGVIGAHTLAMFNVPVEARIEQIRLNMERWRWLPDDLGQRHLLINIPGFDLEAVENDQPTLHMRIIVGQEQHRTPVFSSTMSEVIFHPYWYVPKRLAYEDVLPQLQKNPKLAASKGYELLREEDGERTKVDMSGINWHRLTKADFSHYSFRQRPGPQNALGAVKFRVANDDDIYLHDTSNPNLFTSDVRSLSNGCIRLQHPLAMAEFVLHNLPDWPQSRVDEVYNAPIMPDTEPTAVTLSEPLPVHIMYLTARTDRDGRLRFYDDIYKWDEKIK
jgi:murein L,D-transpeptidase YcbB/YkuD